MAEKVDLALQPGQVLARGCARYLASLGFQTMPEFVPTRGLRVDLIALGPGDEIWIVECKSSRADFQSDNKWHKYLEWCDRFFWAVDADFDVDLLPPEHGLIIADSYFGETVREAPLHKLAPARRKKVTRMVAEAACQRLRRLTDPRL